MVRNQFQAIDEQMETGIDTNDSFDSLSSLSSNSNLFLESENDLYDTSNSIGETTSFHYYNIYL